MSTYQTTTRTDNGSTSVGNARPSRRLSTETKSSYKTTELIAFVAAVIGVLIASAVVDNGDFGAKDAWFFVTLLTIGYMLSRGLAKSGARESYEDHGDNA